MPSRAGLPLIAALAAIAALYASTLTGIARQWVDDSATSHGMLLAAAAAFVLYRRWPALRALPARPGSWGFALLAFGLLTYVVGGLTGDVFILRTSLPIVLAGCIVALWGTGHLRASLPPLVLLTLAIPLPAVVVTHLTLPLQLVASSVAEIVLTGIGFEVARAGNVLMMPHISLEVAEACSGLRSVVSLISVAAICGAVMPLRLPRALLLVAAAIPIAIVGNGYRVAATGVLSTWIGEAAVQGWIHELTGFAAFVAMCGATLVVQMSTRPRDRRNEEEPCSVRA